MLSRAICLTALFCAAPAGAQNFATSAAPDGQRAARPDAPAPVAAPGTVGVFPASPVSPLEPAETGPPPAPLATTPGAPTPEATSIPAPRLDPPPAVAPDAARTPFRPPSDETAALLRLADAHEERMARIKAALTAAKERAIADAQADSARPGADLDAVRAALNARLAEAEAAHAEAAARETRRYREAQLDLLAGAGG